MSQVFRKVIPTLNRVLIKVFKPKMKSAGGLLLTAVGPSLKYGKVIATGPGEVNS